MGLVSNVVPKNRVTCQIFGFYMNSTRAFWVCEFQRSLGVLVCLGRSCLSRLIALVWELGIVDILWLCFIYKLVECKICGHPVDNCHKSCILTVAGLGMGIIRLIIHNQVFS